jgi:opacity protein-like surface antigen
MALTFILHCPIKSSPRDLSPEQTTAHSVTMESNHEERFCWPVWPWSWPVQAQHVPLIFCLPIVEAPIHEPPVSHPVPSCIGWYLRGDVGYSWNKLRGVDFFQGDLNTYARSLVRPAWVLQVGGGGGYQINRAIFARDVTLDYFSKAKFRGSTTGSCGVPLGLYFHRFGAYSGFSLLANAYVDFYKHGRFTFTVVPVSVVPA